MTRAVGGGGLWAEGSAWLATQPAFGPWVDRIGPIDYTLSDEPPFEYLVRSIVYQQLAGAAAATIHGRVCAVLDEHVSPATILRADPDALRAAGLSRAKLRAVSDLAGRVEGGELRLDLAELAELTDDAIVERLSQVWGVGQWTARMFLMFRLGRPDVWPAGDLGVRSGWARIHGLDERPDARALSEGAEHLSPHRSAAAWYCWRALELTDPPES
ncbi:MAG: DNA-3-methyladenine glycosylase 2 family protein [Gemmatimonadetes bacterium]|nr:DNA-3-methyladenine glycosylase 2 family protein [Gemmatimonadota bacterium]